jgi:hypothetical protein
MTLNLLIEHYNNFDIMNFLTNEEFSTQQQ